ncbi:hypothetical protein [uncultured Mameliella sp.]|uniref:hypothetical protein n=1 Tax=uncultured Mameliella sp. TaxID=1447087 RepID=UPI00260B5086|nr:hypothetical protein [uncultured Mameliella sp.]
MNKRILGLILIGGGLLGYGIGGLIWAPPSRDQRIATLFEEICLNRTETPASDSAASLGLVQVTALPARTLWVDATSASFLRVEGRSCSVETFAPNALDREEAEALALVVEDLVQTRFPELDFDPRASMRDDTISRGWAAGASFSPDRRGVFLFAAPDRGEGSFSFLTVLAPKTPG